jgi:hypothetical protein
VTMDVTHPPHPEDFGLQSEWDAAGGGDPTYHREQALESFQGAALSLVFLAPGLILISFPNIHWLGIFALAGLGLFGGFMFFNLVSIGLGELRRARRMRDPAVSAAAKQYKESLSRWRKDAPQLPPTQPRMALERAEMIVREYILALSHVEQPRPMLRPSSQLPYSKAEIRLAFKVIFPTLDPEQETMLKYAYAALAHFIPDEEYVWVEEVWRQRQAQIEGQAPPTDPVGEQRLFRLEKQKSDEWQSLLRDIYDFAARVRPQQDAPSPN